MYAIKCRVHWGGRATDNGRMDCIAGDAERWTARNTQDVDVSLSGYGMSAGVQGWYTV